MYTWCVHVVYSAQTLVVRGAFETADERRRRRRRRRRIIRLIYITCGVAYVEWNGIYVLEKDPCARVAYDGQVLTYGAYFIESAMDGRDRVRTCVIRFFLEDGTVVGGGGGWCGLDLVYWF